MINPKKLLAMARKWQKFVANKKPRISLPRSSSGEGLCSSSLANEGHFVVYTMDEKRYDLQLEYLRSNIFVELFRLSEEEFGLPAEGPITLPCESMFLEYVIRLVHGHVAEDLEKAVLTSMSRCHCSASSTKGLEESYHSRIIFGF